MKRAILAVIAVLMMVGTAAAADGKYSLLPAAEGGAATETAADLSPTKANTAQRPVNYEAEKAAREQELKGLQTDLTKHGFSLSEVERSTKESAFQQRLKEYQTFLKANQ